MTIKINKPYVLKQFISEDKLLSEKYSLLDKESKDKFLKLFCEYIKTCNAVKKMQNSEEFKTICKYLEYTDVLKKIYNFKDFSLINTID